MTVVVYNLIEFFGGGEVSTLSVDVKYVSEKDIDLVILEEFISDKTFTDIFVPKTNLNHYSVLEAVHSMVDIIQGESNLVFILRCTDKRVGLLIENKIDALLKRY